MRPVYASKYFPPQGLFHCFSPWERSSRGIPRLAYG
jgi:hypothetical protein